MNFRQVAAFRWWIMACVGMLALCAVRAANVMPSTRDTLVYKDGDRVQGKTVSESGGVIVFKSDRFGELRVPAADAVVIKADQGTGAEPATVATAPKPEPVPKPAAPPAQPKPVVPAPAAAEAAKAEVAAAEAAEEARLSIWDRFSPSVLTAKVRNVFGPWHGRLSFSTEVVTDVAHRSASSWETHLTRKWKADEVQLNGRYDFSETTHVTTTDIVKLWGQWRHDFNKQIFLQYRPTSEWNRASTFQGVPNDYVLLQQEVGLGWHVFTKPTRKVRVGLSENRFDTWNTAPGLDHTSRGVASSFEEIELSLPWRITISQRGIWYPVPHQQDGWENRVELNKKLTETLSAAVRHELRRHNPDGTAQDYERLKLLFGLDF